MIFHRHKAASIASAILDRRNLYRPEFMRGLTTMRLAGANNPRDVLPAAHSGTGSESSRCVFMPCNRGREALRPK